MLRSLASSWLMVGLALLAVSLAGSAQASPATPAAALVGAQESVPGEAAADIFEILGRAALAMGGPKALASVGDLELTGRIEGSGGSRRWRLLVRLQPPGMREEMWDPGAGPGERSSLVMVCSAQRAWLVPPDSDEALDPGVVAALLDHLHEWRLLLRPLDFTGGARLEGVNARLPTAAGWSGRTGALPEELVPGRPVHSLHTASPTSLEWTVHFDQATGRLLGLDQPGTLTRPWVRLTDWQRFDELMLPTLRIQGSEAFGPVFTTVENVRTGLVLPDALFAGDPWTPRTTPADVAPLEVVASALPGTGYILLPDVRVNGQRTNALFDTAADGLFLDSGLVQTLELGTLGFQRTLTMFGSASTARHIVSTLDIGSERLFQLPANSTRLPALAAFGRNRSPKIVLGGWPLMQLHPVFDLHGGRLISRGAVPVPLEDLPHGGRPGGRTRFDIQMAGTSDERGAHIFLVRAKLAGRDITLLLDTGIPVVLRLSASGLRRLGLPTGRDEWVRRGASVMAMRGAGQQAGEDLLMRFTEVTFGPITLRNPYVQLAGLGGAAEAHEFPYDGLLGAGALLPFARVGFDGRRGVLTVETAGTQDGGADEGPPGFPTVRLADGGRRAVVDDPGLLLGLFCTAPEPGASAPPECLPRVFRVHPGSPAAEAGILTDDRLLSIDGVSVAGRSVGSFGPQLWVQPGRQVTLRLLRAGDSGDGASSGREFEVTL